MHNMLKKLRNEDGTSLAEVVVTMFLLGIVSIIFNSVLSSSLNATRNLENSVRANDDVRLAVQALGRELRAADMVCSPRPGLPSDMLWFFVTDGSGASPTQTEYVYKIFDFDGDGGVDDLIKSSDGGATYRPVADNVSNAAVAADLGVAQPMYINQGANELNSASSVVASPSYGKVISISIWVDESPLDNISPRLETTEVAGRNIWTPNAATCPATPPADPTI